MVGRARARRGVHEGVALVEPERVHGHARILVATRRWVAHEQRPAWMMRDFGVVAWCNNAVSAHNGCADES